MGRPLGGGEEFLHLVGEEHQAYLVVVAHGGEGQGGAEPGGQIPQGFRKAPEALRGGGVHQEEDRELPLLPEALEVGLSLAGGHVPVNGAHIVPGEILPHLLELHAGSPEGGAEFAGQKPGDLLAGLDFQEAYLAGDGCQIHGRRGEIRGRGWSRTRWTMASGVHSWASAS